MDDVTQREIEAKARLMGEEELREEVLGCMAKAASWERSDREYGSSVAAGAEEEAECYRRELRRRGKRVTMPWQTERFCGHEISLADDGSESLELA